MCSMSWLATTIWHLLTPLSRVFYLVHDQQVHTRVSSLSHGIESLNQCSWVNQIYHQWNMKSVERIFVFTVGSLTSPHSIPLMSKPHFSSFLNSHSL